MAENGLTQKRVSKQPECAKVPEKGANQSRKCKTNEYNNGRTGCENIVPDKQNDTTGVVKIGQRRSPDIRATLISKCSS